MTSTGLANNLLHGLIINNSEFSLIENTSNWIETKSFINELIKEINSQKWKKIPEENKFLIGLYKKLLELEIIPEKVNL